MKRFILGILALALVLSAALPCVAAEELAIGDAKAAAGQTLYLTVELKSPVKANTVGITCQFDKTLLSAQPELSSWAATGLLSAFEQDNMGAWAVSGVAELEGKLCVLAFRVKDGAAFDTTAVECTVKFKTDAQEVGQYTAKAQVSCVCAHQYGDWKSAGSMGHERVCSICGGKNTQSHDWDDGTERKENTMTIITKTCLVCKEQLKTEMPSEPEGGQVITPEQAPDHTHPQPSEGTQNNQIPDGVEVIIGEDGSVINKDTGDVIVPGKADDLVVEDGHDHSHDDTLTIGASDGHDHDHTPGGESPVTLWVILAVLAVAVAAGVLFLKKKH